MAAHEGIKILFVFMWIYSNNFQCSPPAAETKTKRGGSGFLFAVA